MIRRAQRYYGSAAQPELIPPLPSSMYGRVEEAVHRAVERIGSAVTFHEIRAEIDQDPRLSLSGAPVSRFFSALVRCGRITSIPALRPNSRDLYYSTPDGPQDVKAGTEYPLDRCYRAAQSLWARAGRYPFTGAALRLHAESDPELRISHYRPSTWSHALSQLEKCGAVTRVQMIDGSITRWAPTEEWNRLSAEAQERCVQGSAGGQHLDSSFESVATFGALTSSSDREPVPKFSSYHMGAPPLAQILRRLVEVTQDELARKQSDPHSAGVVRNRPVTVREITQTLGRNPELAPPLQWPLRDALSHATRPRSRSRTREIVSVGCVLNCTYYNVVDDPAGAMYVAYLAALRAAAQPDLARSLRNLQSAAQSSASGVVPLPASILSARADLLLAGVRATKEALDQASAPVPLLPGESGHLGDLRAELEGMLAQLTLLRDSTELVSSREYRLNPSTDLADVKYARQCLEGIVHAGFATRRMLSVALRLVPVIRDETINPRTVIGGSAPGRARRTECFLDRIGFICYGLSRWAGIRLATLGSQASHAIGDLRDPRLFIAGLQSGSLAVHTLMAAALAVFDTPESRDALVEYLATFLAPGGSRSTSISAVEVAIVGLAPVPFAGLADQLRAHERQALISVAAATDPGIGWIARRVLTSWDERWTRDQLLQL